MRAFLLNSENIKIGLGRLRRLMRRMAIHPFYPAPNLSKLGKAKYVQPYLIRDLAIDHPNQVWSTDITYISMSKGFMYLYAIIDVYSRKIVGWGLYNTLEASNAIDVLQRAIASHGTPEIINSDQGSQYTCPLWIDTIKSLSIKVSMDGRGRCRDNAWIERFWRTLKTEYVYLNPHDTAEALRFGISGYIDYYNNRRYHSSIGGLTPSQKYLQKLTSAA
jgi:putative transposase